MVLPNGVRNRDKDVDEKLNLMSVYSTGFHNNFALLGISPDNDADPHSPERNKEEYVFQPGEGLDSQEPSCASDKICDAQYHRNGAQDAALAAQ